MLELNMGKPRHLLMCVTDLDKTNAWTVYCDFINMTKRDRTFLDFNAQQANVIKPVSSGTFSFKVYYFTHISDYHGCPKAGFHRR